MRDAAVPRPRPGGVDAGHAGDRRHGGRARRSSTRCRSGASPRTTARRWYSAVPTHPPAAAGARRSRRRAKPAGAEKLRFIRSCSASLPPQVMHDLEAAFGAPVLEAYGMTEAAHQMASNPLPPGARKPGSVGPGTDVGISIMDGERHAAAAGRARRGRASTAPTSSRGYENNPEANATSFFDGWFRTGDQGYPRRRRLPDARRPAEGDDQPRRREDLAARDRRGAAGASGGRRGRVLRRAAPDVGRRSGGRRGRCAKARPPRPTCSPTARSGWPTSSGRSRFTSPRRFRARPPARSSAASSRRRSRRKAS